MAASCDDETASTLALSRMTQDHPCLWETLSTVPLSQQCPRFSSRVRPPRRPRQENLPTKCFHTSPGIVAVCPRNRTLCRRGKVVVFGRCPQAQFSQQGPGAPACQERSVSLRNVAYLTNSKVNNGLHTALLFYERVQQYWLIVEFMCFRKKTV